MAEKLPPLRGGHAGAGGNASRAAEERPISRRGAIAMATVAALASVLGLGRTDKAAP